MCRPNCSRTAQHSLTLALLVQGEGYPGAEACSNIVERAQCASRTYRRRQEAKLLEFGEMAVSVCCAVPTMPSFVHASSDQKHTARSGRFFSATSERIERSEAVVWCDERVSLRE